MIYILMIVLVFAAIKGSSELLHYMAGTLKDKLKEPCRGHKWERLNDDSLWCSVCEKTFIQVIEEKT